MKIKSQSRKKNMTKLQHRSLIALESDVLKWNRRMSAVITSTEKPINIHQGAFKISNKGGFGLPKAASVTTMNKMQKVTMNIVF